MKDMLQSMLQQRNLPELLTPGLDWEKRRSQVRELICQEEYGYLPLPPKKLTGVILDADSRYCASKATLERIQLTVHTEVGEFSFPISCAYPNGGEPVPALIHINFRNDVPDKYTPTEEICDHGFGVVSFCYQDVTSDDGNFQDGLAEMFFPTGERKGASAGKLMLWAWAAMRVMDYLVRQPWVDAKNIAIVGHSRLGKAALLAGALDERFAFTISNNSGCGGAALSRGKAGETASAICRKFPFWFCENFQTYVNREQEMPMDQHFLLSLIAPRRLYVDSAEDDAWSDPASEFLGCMAVTPAYRQLGSKGLVAPDRLPAPGDVFHEGEVGYHLRSGSHYLSRYDWLRFLEFMKKHKRR